MADVFGYIAYGGNELYHRGALLSALKLLHHCPTARVIVATDRPDLFNGYPVETLLLTTEMKERFSSNGRYHFGVKAGAMIELLRQAHRLIFMDTDTYPVGDLSNGFQRITPVHSFMRRCEASQKVYLKILPGAAIKIGHQRLRGQDAMWHSSVVGVHHDNLPALLDAFAAIQAVGEATDTWAPERFFLRVVLSHNGRSVSPHSLPVRHYNTRGKKAFAEPRVHQFFSTFGSAPIDQQIAKAARYRLWRTPIDVWKQRVRWVRPVPSLP